MDLQMGGTMQFSVNYTSYSPPPLPLLKRLETSGYVQGWKLNWGNEREEQGWEEG